MRRVLLDQGLAPSAAQLLRDAKWEAVHVSEIGLQTADDSEIIETARLANRVCVTLDHDFHEHLALTGSTSPSVVRLRVQGLDAIAQAALISSVWQTCERSIIAGCAVSADTKTVRVRKLPLKVTTIPP